MKKYILILFILVASVSGIKAQKNDSNLEAYWGSVTSLSLSKEQLSNIESFSISDTINIREIKWISRYKFYVQSAQKGPVRVIHGNGSFIDQKMKSYFINPESGDKIIFSEIFAYVENEGVRKIPTAIVLVVK